MKKLILYDTLTATKQEVAYNKAKAIKIFACGPTVYDDIHIGNAIPLLVIDIIVRLLTYQKQPFQYLQNITDIDDKIINRALAENKTEKAISDFYLKSFMNNQTKLNIIKPNFLPRVSDYIQEQIDFIAELVTHKKAYVNEGNVYFDTKQYINSTPPLAYNMLAHKNLQAHQGRLSEAEYKAKKNYWDFILWKKTSQGVKFDSPWGKGRPGWHTECCVLNNLFYKGQTLDIHAGGIDLKFPHHENERIQYIAANKVDLAKIWIYNGHLKVEQVKMSKSLKNTWMLHQFIEDYSANVLRFIFLNSRYSLALNVSEVLVQQALKTMHKWEKLAQTLLNIEIENINTTKAYVSQVEDHLADNLNTANALTVLGSLVKAINKQLTQQKLVSKSLKQQFFTIYENLLGFTIPKQGSYN